MVKQVNHYLIKHNHELFHYNDNSHIKMLKVCGFYTFNIVFNYCLQNNRPVSVSYFDSKQYFCCSGTYTFINEGICVLWPEANKLNSASKFPFFFTIRLCFQLVDNYICKTITSVIFEVTIVHLMIQY